MTATIDKRIVEMAFQNDKFEKNVGTSLSTLDKLKKSLNFGDSAKSFSDITAAAGRVNLSSISDSLNSVSNKFSAMGIFAITTLVNIANAAYQTGLSIAKALIITPVTTGFSEFELKMGSIQTIMAGTGESLETVNQKLDELNTYSDKTIYSFADMTTNIGKFTNAGVSLDKSVAAIQGIANAAALSGSNANEASRAMYNFAQAISAGSVKLIDWKSIELANMATREFKQQIIDTAVAMGTVKKLSDGMYQAITGGEVFNATKMFNQSLEQQWFTTDVLTDVLGKYADATTDVGARATAAAQDVKTLSMLYDTLKEAAQSGWAQTWEIIVGDFEQGKSLFTSLSNYVGGIIGASADARNALLQGWDDLGGRTKLLEAFGRILNAIVSVINPITAGMREIFPPATAETLYNMTEALNEFAYSLKLSPQVADQVRRIFKGLFALFDIGVMAITALTGSFSDLAWSSIPPLSRLIEYIAKVGDYIVELRETLKSSNTFVIIFGNIATVIKSVIDGVGGFFAALIGGFKSTDKMTKSKSLSNFLEKLGEKFKAFGKLGIIISKVFGLLSKLVAKLGPIAKKIASIMGDLANKILDSLTKSLDNLDVNKVLDFLNKGLLAGVLLSIKGFVDSSKSVIGGGLFAGILLSIKTFIDEGGSVFTGVKGILDGVKNSLDSYQKTLKAEALMKIAGAIAVLALSIVALALVDQNKLISATAAIGAMFVGLSTTLNVFEKTTGSGAKLLALTGSLLGISVSLLVLAGAITILSKLDPKEAIQGTLAIGAVLGLLVLFQKFSSGPKGMIGAVSGLFALSVAMIALGFAIRSLGSMETEVLIQGLLAIGTAIGIISVGLKSMAANLTGAGSLLISSAAILVLAISLEKLGSLSLEQIGIGLLAIAGVLTVLGVAASILTPLAPTIAIIAISMLAMGVAAGAFGLGIFGIGVGLGALAAGIVTLSTLSAAGIAALTLVITGIAALIPMLATQVVKGITAFVLELYKSAPKIGLALVGIGVELLKGFAALVPEIVETILVLVETLLTKLEEHLPNIVTTGYKVLLGFLSGVRDNIGEVVTVSIDIVNAYLDAVATKIPELVDSGFNLIIAWLDGMTAGVEEHLPTLITSVQKLGLAIIEGIIAGLIEGRNNAVNSIKEIGQMLIDEFKYILGIESPSTVFAELALNIILGLINGFKDNVGKVITQVLDLGEDIIDALKTKYSNMVDAGKDLVLGLAEGIKKYVSEAVTAAAQLAEEVLKTVASVFVSESPSKKMFDQGKYVDQGLAGGITKFASLVVGSVKELGDNTLTSFSGVVSRISESLSNEMDFNPTIRPVIDFTDIEKGGSKLDSIFGGKKLDLALATSKAGSISSGSPNTDSVNVDQTKPNESTISFTQNNYSPKELSRIELYRQTRNQLLQAKGLGKK